ncbi:DgyrCDS13678 [Dimorphilus gyrociliatus]|uniref:DgyrCDS13678 n=1 Tax=Dimorphilus gyrociliatus TaxID=2664684 RepID=A0A7I8WBF2_9ANNE|nr:DgyrCDS13678 [Dimorphilus gyrociliatus]
MINTVNYDSVTNLLIDLDSCDPKYENLQTNVVLMPILYFNDVKALYPQIGRRFSYDIGRKFSFFICYIGEFKERGEAEEIFKNALSLSENDLQTFKRKIVETRKDDKFYENSIGVIYDFFEFLSEVPYLGCDEDMKDHTLALSEYFVTMIKKYGEDFLKYFDIFDGYDLNKIRINQENLSDAVDYLAKINRWENLCKHGRCPGKTNFDATLSKFFIDKVELVQFKNIKKFFVALTDILKAFRKTDLFNLLRISKNEKHFDLREILYDDDINEASL